jgi:serine/threonine protein kinase
MPQNDARMFAAIIVSALEHVHARGYAYRDIKPENLILDREGYPKLVDFGFSKYLREGQKTSTLCGTPDYLAPELVLAKGHSRAADFWALGSLVYELLCARTPFEDERTGTVFKKIVASQEHLNFEQGFPPDARFFICQLLNPSPGMRLGMLNAGAEDVRKHRWFGGVDWGTLAARGYRAPFVPDLTGPLDSSRFDDFDEEDDRVEVYEGAQEPFESFSLGPAYEYVAPFP